MSSINLNLNQEEICYEVPMTIDELKVLVERVESASKIAKKGQILRIKINPEICLVFKGIARNQIQGLPVIGSLHGKDINE